MSPKRSRLMELKYTRIGPRPIRMLALLYRRLWGYLGASHFSSANTTLSLKGWMIFGFSPHFQLCLKRLGSPVTLQSWLLHLREAQAKLLTSARYSTGRNFMLQFCWILTPPGNRHSNSWFTH